MTNSLAQRSTIPESAAQDEAPTQGKPARPIHRRVTTATVSSTVYARLLAAVDGDASRVGGLAGALIHAQLGVAALPPPLPPPLTVEDGAPPSADANAVRDFAALIETARRRHPAGSQRARGPGDGGIASAELRAGRERLGLSQRDVCALVPCGRGVYAMIEGDQRQAGALRAEIKAVLDRLWLEHLRDGVPPPAPAVLHARPQPRRGPAGPPMDRARLAQQSCPFCGAAYGAGTEAGAGCATCAELRAVVSGASGGAVAVRP